MREGTNIWHSKNFNSFIGLDDEESKMLDHFSRIREIRKGEWLYRQGSSDKYIYILKKGAVKITKLTPHGKEIILNIFRGGSIFDEMAVEELQERDESAEVIEDGHVCIMTRENFDLLLQMIPELGIKIKKMIDLKLWKIENRLLDLLYRTVEQRLAKTFLGLLDDFGVPYDSGHLLKLKLTHKDYADLIASTRETVTATLNKFKKEGIIDFDGKYVLLRSLKKIRALAE